MELQTNAEAAADRARNLPNFKSLSLPGVREEVTQLLLGPAKYYDTFGFLGASIYVWATQKV